MKMPEHDNPPQIRMRLSITVRADAPPRAECPPPPPPPPPEPEEVVARRWLERTGQYVGKKKDLSHTWYMHFVSCLKQPCGRAERQGSQQHSIEMVVPSREAANELLQPASPGLHAFLNQKYTVDPETRVACWRKSKSTDTYRIEDGYLLGQYLALHTRQLDKHLMLYDGSKLAPITKKSGYTHACVLISFLPPLTLEVVRRTTPRVWVLKAELNSQVFNDLEGQTLPPHYEYGPGMDVPFRELALYHLEGMRRRGFKLSTHFQCLLEGVTQTRPFTDDEDSDGEAAASSVRPSRPFPTLAMPHHCT